MEARLDSGRVLRPVPTGSKAGAARLTAAERAQAHRKAVAAEWGEYQAEYRELLALEQARPRSGPSAVLSRPPQRPAALHVQQPSTVLAARRIRRSRRPPARRARPPGHPGCHLPQ